MIYEEKDFDYKWPLSDYLWYCSGCSGSGGFGWNETDGGVYLPCQLWIALHQKKSRITRVIRVQITMSAYYCILFNKSTFPSLEAVKNSIQCTAAMFKCYGPGIIDIIFGGVSAKEAIIKCEKSEEGEE